ncbi:MAG: hypothetical protein R3F59_18490 [Myxococcota bacterium]
MPRPHRRRTLPLLALALLAGSASAATPRIGVVGIHQSSLGEPQQRTLCDRLVTAIEAAGDYDALSPGEVAAAVAGREEVVLEEGLLSQAREALQNGKNAYNQASPDDAITLLQQALEAYRGVFSGAFVVEEVWETWVYLGTSHLQKDPPDEAAARKAFAAALALLPDRPLNPALYPPHVIELFGDVRSELLPHGVKLELTLAAGPGEAPATVRIDGIEKGVTPLTVTGVLPGEHFVVARESRREAFARLDVPMAGTDAGGAVTPIVQQVPLALGVPVLGEAASTPVGRAEQIASLYGALGRRAQGVDYLLVTGVADGSLSLQLLRVATGTFSQAVALPLAGDPSEAVVQAVPLMLATLKPDGSFTATAPAPAPLDIGADSLLALLLDGFVQPVTAAPVPVPVPVTPRERGGKPKVGLVLGIVGGVVAASAAGTGGYLLLQKPEPIPPEQGVIRVAF